jgi:TIR domain
MATAFFSYSRRDSEFALRLAGDLKAAGKSVWIDQLDIVPGEQWDRAIEKDLGRSPIMLVILSPASVESDNVMDEVSFALRERKRIIPIICKNCRIPFRLDRLQRVDFTEDYDRGLNDLLKALDSGEEVGPADAFRAALSSVPASDLPKAETTVTPTPATRVASTPAARQSVRAVSAGGGTAAAPALAREAAAPTRAPAPGSPPSAAPVAPVVARPSSRGAWVAIGALLGAGALIAAGIYVPRQFRAHADPNKTVIPDKDSAGPPEPTTTASIAKPDTPSAKSAPVGSVQSDQGSIKVDANGSGAAKMSDKKGAGVVVTPPVPPRKDLSSGSPAPARGASPQMPVATAPPAQPSGPSAEEIAKIEDEADKLNIRGATASKSLDTLRQQQNAAGYNLRADIAASQERMQLYLAKGNDALKAQDYAKAQKYFDLADAEISKVEKFLGH